MHPHRRSGCSDSSRETWGRKVATFYWTEACGTSRDGRKLLARDRICSQVPWYRPYSETYGFNPTRNVEEARSRMKKRMRSRENPYVRFGSLFPVRAAFPPSDETRPKPRETAAASHLLCEVLRRSLVRPALRSRPSDGQPLLSLVPPFSPGGGSLLVSSTACRASGGSSKKHGSQ